MQINYIGYSNKYVLKASIFFCLFLMTGNLVYGQSAKGGSSLYCDQVLWLTWGDGPTGTPNLSWDIPSALTSGVSYVQLRGISFVVSVTVSLVALVILFLIWHYWRQSKKNVQVLADLGKQVFNQKLQLEKSNKAITRIMNVVAHDLRNPLTGIKGFSSMLLNEENLTDEQKKWIRLMHDSSGHAMELINEMMDSNVLDVLENRHKSIKKEFADMRPYLRRCVDVLQFRAGEKGQTIELDLEEDATVSLNRDAMFRVIGNLIGNAIKFSHKDSTIRLSMENLTDTVLLSVQDSGIGIPDDLKETVFDMFTEAKRPGTTGEQSFGLGLSISKQIVEAHGGRIWFESEEGKGTTVYIELPVVEQHSEVK